MKCPACGTMQYLTRECRSCGYDFKAGQIADAHRPLPFKPKPTSRAERARRIDAAVSFVFAAVVTWALPEFLLAPLFHALRWEFTWWMYVLLFLFSAGSAMSAQIKHRALENIAYDNTVVKTDDRTKFCPQCGHEIQTSARFCSNCGADRE